MADLIIFSPDMDAPARRAPENDAELIRDVAT